MDVAYTSINSAELERFVAALGAHEARPYTRREALNAFWAFKAFSVEFWRRGYARMRRGVILFGSELGAILGVKARQARNYLRAWKIAGVAERHGWRLVFRVAGLAAEASTEASTERRAVPDKSRSTSNIGKEESSRRHSTRHSTLIQALEAIEDPDLRRAIRCRATEHEAKHGEAPGPAWAVALAGRISIEERDEINERGDQVEADAKRESDAKSERLRQQRERNELADSRLKRAAKIRERFAGFAGEVRIAAARAVELAIPERFRGTTNSIVLERIEPAKARARERFLEIRIDAGLEPPLD